MAYLWVPAIGSGTRLDPQRANVPDGVAFQYALPIQTDPTTGKTTVATVPISVADGVTMSTAVAAPPSEDAALYASALIEFVAIGALTQAQAEALATALGLQLD